MRFNWFKFSAWMAASLCGSLVLMAGHILWKNGGDGILICGMPLMTLGCLHCALTMFSEGRWWIR